MDPGNWATDLAGGARFGYTLLSVIMLSNLMAILLQALAVRLGVGTSYDLAQACRAYYSRRASIVLWVLAEIAIAACDLAEVIGSAVALNLLFGVPLALGVVITALDVLIVLFVQQHRFRILEGIVVTLILGIAGGFAVELFLSRPDLGGVLRGFVPSPEILRNPDMLYIAVGILGATVMPHNLYLHSSVVQTRMYADTDAGKTRSDPVRDHRFDGRADVGALHQRGDPGRGGRDVPRHPVRMGGRHHRRLQAARAAARARRWRARCSRCRCCSRGRTRRSRARWPARS